MTLSQEAKLSWIDFYNHIEEMIGNGHLSDMRDFASKISNNVARVAALIHYYEFETDEINSKSMSNAINFGYNCIDSFKYLFAEKTTEQKAFEYAKMLYDWFIKNSTNTIFKKFLYTFGPNKLRNKENLEMALWRLHNDGEINYYANAKPAYIIFNNRHRFN